MPETATITAEKTKAGFDFEKEVAEIWRNFPEIKDKIFFIDVGTHKLVYPGDKATAQRHRERLSENEDLLESVRYYKEEAKTSAFINTGEGSGYVVVYTETLKDNPWNDVFASDQLLTFTFDHEFAHSSIGNASQEGILSESIADAYAMIRHFQRYGTNDGAGEKVLGRRTRILALDGDKTEDYRLTHFTSPVLAEIVKRRDEIDWSALDLKETAQLARRFGLQYTPHPTTVAALDHTLSDVHGAKSEKARVNKLAALLQETTSGLLLKWGSIALRSIADQKADDSDLQKVWKSVAKRAGKLEGGDEILFGLKSTSPVAAEAGDGGSFELVFGSRSPKPAVIANRR